MFPNSYLGTFYGILKLEVKSMKNTGIPRLLKDYLVYLTTIKGKSPRTRKEYEYDLVLAFKFIKSIEEDIPIEQADISDIHIDWLKERSIEDFYLFFEYCTEVRKNSATSRARKVSSLKGFFNYLKIRRRLLEENITEQLETPKIGKRSPTYMQLDEAKSFIRSTKERKYSKRDYCLMMFLLNTGMRVSELCNLNMQSLDGRQLKIIGKGNKERVVYLNDACMEALQEYLIERKPPVDPNEDPLFTSQKGTRFTRQSIARVVKAINISSINKDNITPHKLRHTSATMMYRAGADIRSLQQILGHTNIGTTQIYTHIEDEQIQEVLANNPFNTKTF